MHNKAEVQAHVHVYQVERGLSTRELARRVGLNESALARMLRPDTDYRGDRDKWSKLARYAPLGLSERAVLQALGFEPMGGEDGEPAPDPYALLEQAMATLALDEESRDHLRRQVRLLARLTHGSPTPSQ